MCMFGLLKMYKETVALLKVGDCCAGYARTLIDAKLPAQDLPIRQLTGRSGYLRKQCSGRLSRLDSH